MTVDDHKLVIIYALVDPRTDADRYVGGTSTSLRVRLSDHIRTANEHSRRAKWIRELIGLGLKPRIRALETVSWSQRNKAEVRWISKLHARKGSALTNKQTGGGIHSTRRKRVRTSGRAIKKLKGMINNKTESIRSLASKLSVAYGTLTSILANTSDATVSVVKRAQKLGIKIDDWFSN